MCKQFEKEMLQFMNKHWFEYDGKEDVFEYKTKIEREEKSKEKELKNAK